MASVGKQLYCGTKMRLNSFKFWFYSSFHSRVNTAAHPSLIFHSIMYLLPSQIGLISITLPQNWINFTLTSLPDPRRQSRFSQSRKNVWRGWVFCWKCSDYRSCSHVQVCSITSISSLTLPLIHFLDKMNSPPLTVNTGIMENYERRNQLQKKTAGSSLSRLLQSSPCLLVLRLKYDRLNWYRAVLTDALWYFMAKVNRITDEQTALA